MLNDTHRGSHSTDSVSTDRSYSAQSSMEDEEMLDVPGNQFLNYDIQQDQAIESLHDILRLDTDHVPQSPPDPSSMSSAFTPNLSRISSVAAQGPDSATYEELMRKVWVFPPNVPVNIIKYSIGRRELAMQTQIDQPFNLVEPDPQVHPPVHTFETENLKAWHKMVTRTPTCLPKRDDEPAMPRVKLAFGPLGWDQVWAYEYINLEGILRNASYKDWWVRHSYDHLIWCGMHKYIEIYGVEVKFPYGYDTTITTITTPTSSSAAENSEFSKEIPIRIPANESVLVSLGKPVIDWGKQLSFLYDYSEDGPPLPYPFATNAYMQPPFTITLRFKNTHPDTLILSPNPTITQDKGNWTKSWLSTDELTILSGEINTTYLHTILDGGPHPNASLTNNVNRANILQFWGLDRKRNDMIEHLLRQEWMWERFDVDGRERGAEEMFRSLIRDRIYESLMRAVRDLPF